MGRRLGARRPGAQRCEVAGRSRQPAGKQEARQLSDDLAAEGRRKWVAPLSDDCCPIPVTDLHTERLILRPIDPEEAGRIIARHAGPQDSWARDFPFQGDVISATMFLRATTAHGDQRPFGHYVILQAASGQAIGGIGFKGQPDQGTGEIGYGLAPSGRGNGFAAESVRALVDLAREQAVASGR